MVKTVVCSTGTSAHKGPRKQLEQLLQEQDQVEKAADLLFSKFRDTPPEGENLQKVLSAEIHSLVRIGITHKDRVVLLASSTDDGYCCALAVEKYLKHHWQGINVETKQITGLQVKDANLFRREGVVEFVKHVLKEIEDCGADNVVLNPTGGFKALVPYTVLVGMLKGVTCQYIFEQSKTLLDLPPFPVEFMRSRFENYRKIFEQIERETSISQEEWKKIPYAEQTWLKTLVEEVGDEVTLSAVGFLFLEEVRSPSKLVPFLSRPAVKDYLDLRELPDCNPFDYLSRVARSEEALKKATHVNAKDGLYWLKPGNTPDRYLVSVDGWRLLVWRGISEGKVGKNYPREVTVDTSDRQKYYPFMRMEFFDWDED